MYYVVILVMILCTAIGAAAENYCAATIGDLAVVNSGDNGAWIDGSCSVEGCDEWDCGNPNASDSSCEPGVWGAGFYQGNYDDGDVVAIAGGTGGLAIVTTDGTGHVESLTVSSPGSNYTKAVQTTTAVTGSGTGLTVRITRYAP